ncbi:scavenger receptor cysteine-rich type 1 protein M130-like [Thunnus maccoyii]|nr:scavenger receptor cysteine-rich type 1 protein M130-like [Thunnus maccoyii]
MWTEEFQCGGHESALQDCGRSDSTRNTCSSGKAVGLTCSEPVRLVGGASHCAGTLEVKYQGHWKPVDDFSMEAAAAVCTELNCGAALSTGKVESERKRVLSIHIPCVEDGFAVRECVDRHFSPSHLEITCSDDLHLKFLSTTAETTRNMTLIPI